MSKSEELNVPRELLRIGARCVASFSTGYLTRAMATSMVKPHNLPSAIAFSIGALCLSQIYANAAEKLADDTVSDILETVDTVNELCSAIKTDVNLAQEDSEEE